MLTNIVILFHILVACRDGKTRRVFNRRVKVVETMRSGAVRGLRRNRIG